MPKWSDFGNVWATLRELDINAIREEAERPLAIACVGHEAAVDEVDRLLHTGSARYPAGANPLEIIPLAQAAGRSAAARSADMLILAIDARQTLTPGEAESFGQLETLTIPFLVVQLYGDRLPTGAASLTAPVRTRAVVIAEPAVLDAPDRLAGELLTRLPGELHLSAARRLPGLRAMFARELIGSVAFTNATYSLASGLPQQIPIFSIPFAAADILVLTKNQALLVYKLALGYGASSDFQAHIREILPVIGGAFLWRQAARSLVGLIPFWGLLPKVAVAYAGTYTTGVAAWRWYESGEIVSTDQLKRISTEAMTIGRARAIEIMARARVASATAGARVQASGGGILSRLKRLFSRRKPPQLTPPGSAPRTENREP